MRRVVTLLVMVAVLLFSGSASSMVGPWGYGPLPNLRTYPVVRETTRALVILVGFPDFPTGAMSLAQAQRTFFGQKNSVATYLAAQSMGNFHLKGTVIGGAAAGQKSEDLILPEPTSYYLGLGKNNGDTGMAWDALGVLGRAGFNFAPYTSKAGQISQLVFLFSVPGNNNRSSVFYSGQTYWDGDFEATYAQGQVRDQSFVSQSDGMGTFAHEFGHMLGFVDIYNLDYQNYQNSCIAGVWDLYDRGNFNDNGQTPGPIDPYQRLTVGWLKPTLLTQTGTYTLPPVETSGQVDVIAFPKDHEEYVIENVEPIGYDANLPGRGLLVWRIDTSLAVPQGPTWVADLVNDWGPGAHSHPGISLVSAGGWSIGDTCGSSADPFPGANSVTSFSDVTTPSTVLFDGKPAQTALTHIDRSGDIVTFNFVVP